MRYTNDQGSIFDEQFKEGGLTDVGTWGQRLKHWIGKAPTRSQSVGSYTDSTFVHCVEKHAYESRLVTLFEF